MTILEDSHQWTKALLLASCFMFVIGSCGSPLTTRLYFLHGGNNIWLSGWLQTAGWPIILIPLAVSYISRRRRKAPKLILINSTAFFGCLSLGFINSSNNFLYSIGSSKLPVSTSSLILGCQLVFISAFAFLLVKQRFTVFSIAAVVFLTAGACVLPLQTGSDLPEGVTGKEYVLGFVAMLVMAAVSGLYVPLMEIVIGKANQALTFTLLMEFSIVVCCSATLFSTVGMLINQDFTVILQEARAFELGQVKYYLILGSIAFSTQCLYLGTNGIVLYGSSLFFGIANATMLPITEILGVILYRETFQITKVIALLLSLSGFASYFYGEIQQSKEEDQFLDSDTSPLIIQDV